MDFDDRNEASNLGQTIKYDQTLTAPMNNTADFFVRNEENVFDLIESNGLIRKGNISFVLFLGIFALGY